MDVENITHLKCRCQQSVIHLESRCRECHAFAMRQPLPLRMEKSHSGGEMYQKANSIIGSQIVDG